MSISMRILGDIRAMAGAGRDRFIVDQRTQKKGWLRATQSSEANLFLNRNLRGREQMRTLAICNLLANVSPNTAIVLAGDRVLGVWIPESTSKVDPENRRCLAAK
jgi:hypothetical protein